MNPTPTRNPGIVFADEGYYKSAICEGMRYIEWIPQLHEDKYSNFIPDLSFAGNNTGGWIEVKWCRDDPASLSAIQHWTMGQELVLRSWGARGTGHCYLLVGTPRRHILWRYDCLEKLRGLPFDQALTYAFIIEPTVMEFVEALKAAVRPRGR